MTFSGEEAIFVAQQDATDELHPSQGEGPQEAPAVTQDDQIIEVNSHDDDMPSSSKESFNQVMKKIQSADEKSLNKVLGKLSWVENPENEKILLEKMQKYPLYEILTMGMSHEE